MVINCLTTFPSFIESIKDYSMIKRGIEMNLIDIRVKNIRDYSKDPNKRTDDYPYGGGLGMLMTCQPIVDTLKSIEDKGRVIYLSPAGEKLTQDKLNELSKLTSITLLCGHYEGIDQRIIDNYVDEEISVGDYVLTGGEIPAMILIDGLVRLKPGLLRNDKSFSEESFYTGLLEHPQYTRPYEFENHKVPEILLSGHHENVRRFNLENSIKLTLKKRPDLIKKILEDNKVDVQFKNLINKIREEENS